MEADLDPKNPKAIELHSAVERGDIQGMSFAFIVDGEEWTNLDSDLPLRRITHISEIFEVSAVTWPAYEGTSIQSERSLESELASLNKAREELESARARSAKVAELNNELKEIQS
jgi:phage head maturation protease